MNPGLVISMLFGVALLLAAYLWRDDILVWLGIRTNWKDPKNAPPAFKAAPHAYEPAGNLPCCRQCGGGSAHSIHAGVAAQPWGGPGVITGYSAPAPMGPADYDRAIAEIRANLQGSHGAGPAADVKPAREVTNA